MTFLPITSHDELDDAAKAASDQYVEATGGPITNTGATLLAHLPSFEAYAQWYRLRDELVPYIGERATSLFAYAIAEEGKSAISTAAFRKVLVDSGENVDDPQVTEAEQLLMDWGRLIARAPHEIPEEMYARLETSFNPKLRLILVAFAAQTVASSLFNTVGRVPLDAELAAHQK